MTLRLSQYRRFGGEHQRVTTLQNLISLRDLDRADVPALRAIIDSTDLFPSEMLEPMVELYLTEQAPHHWLVACHGETVVGFAYAEPERMTDKTFNLLLIAVDATLHRGGIGKALVAGLIDRLRKLGGRILIVETSSLGEFVDTRSFYAGLHFAEEARIRDFYAEGEDKIVFWKHL